MTSDVAMYVTKPSPAAILGYMGLFGSWADLGRMESSGRRALYG
jgi:hypothetical protein